MKMGWVVYSLLAACSFAVMVLLYKKMLLLGINQNILNWAVFGLVFLGFSGLLVIERTSPKLSLVLILLLLLTSALSFAGNYLQVKAFNEAPNPGFASTIIAVQLIMISLLSVFFFKSELQWINFLGIGIVILGAYLVSV